MLSFRFFEVLSLYTLQSEPLTSVDPALLLDEVRSGRSGGRKKGNFGPRTDLETR